MKQRREAILVFDKTYTANDTADPDADHPVIDLRRLDVPMLLMVASDDGGGSAPLTPSLVVKIQHAPTRDGPFADVSGLANTAITTAGAQLAIKEQTAQIGPFVKALATVSFGTANDGSRLRAWLVGPTN